MNDENTLRTYGKKTDAYTVFSKMLKRGHPPADRESLTQETEETIDGVHNARRTHWC